MNLAFKGSELIVRIPLAHLLAYAQVEKVKAGLEFTTRQKQIIALLGGGLTYKEIGSKLNIAERTVKFHIGGIMQLVGLRTKKDLARYFQGNTN